MSLHKIEWTSEQCGWALWHIEESEEVLAGMVGPEDCPHQIASCTKRLEWLAGRTLLKLLAEKAGLSYQGLIKDEFGKPSLEKHDHYISLSHSYPYVAAQIDTAPVGIDIEQPRDKLLRIAPRVFNLSEQLNAGKNVTKNCIFWCAKEALYKIHGHGGISFSKNLMVQPFTLAQNGYLSGKILINGEHRMINLGYLVEESFVLVYTKN